ncbi:MAG: helix-turn-helix transcriptional regulator [Chitinophagales bacterium]|nr:helix-turn-helix transcriptional regulator [Chitinophagales bacterium]
MTEINFPKIYIYRRIVKAKLFIDDHFDSDIDLDAIADEAFFSKFHFIRLFKKTYHKTPHQYLIYVRIEKTRLYLKAGISVSQACYSAGFDSTSSFAGLFKKMEGISPSVYRDKQHLLQKEIQAAPLKFVPHCFAEKKGWSKKTAFETKK